MPPADAPVPFARSKRADPKGESTGDEFRRARAPQSNGARRSIPKQRGAGPVAACERQRCVSRHRRKGGLSSEVRNHQPISADQVLRNHSVSVHCFLALSSSSTSSFDRQPRDFRGDCCSIGCPLLHKAFPTCFAALRSISKLICNSPMSGVLALF